MPRLKLTDVAKINMGQSPSSETYNTNRNGLPFYQGNVDFGEKYPSARIWCDKPTKIAEPGDILISVRAPVGALNYAKEECCIGRGLAAITPDANKTSPEFIYWLLRANHANLNRMGTGSTFKAINRKTLEDITLPDYKKDEQYNIAKILSKIDAITHSKKSQIKQLDELVKARFVEMFDMGSCPIKPLSEIAEYWNGLTYKPSDVSSDGTIVLRSSNIQDMQLDLNDIVRVKCVINDKKMVKPNDILMCSRNGSAKLVGKVALIPELKEAMSFGAFMMIIRSEYYPYLMTYFQLPAFRSQISTGTTTINQITRYMLDKVSLPVPDMTKIEEFRAFVAQVDKSKFAIQKSLEKTQLLFDSLMQEYFG